MLFSMSSCEINSISVWYCEILRTWVIKGLARHATWFHYWLTCWMREGRVGRDQGWHSCAETREWCHRTHHSSSWARRCFARTPQCLSFRRIGTWRTHKPHLREKCKSWLSQTELAGEITQGLERWFELNLRARMHSRLSSWTQGGMFSNSVRLIMSCFMILVRYSSVAGHSSRALYADRFLFTCSTI